MEDELPFKVKMLSPFFSVMYPCDETAKWLDQWLSKIGFKVLQTFDLQDVRLSIKDCPCPLHGTDPCDCQMIVLFIYGNTSVPATLILHGYDGKTWISLAEGLGQTPNTMLVTIIKETLQGQVNSVQ